ncbi:hypothetical protein L211DRAFT_787412, partial [Terfezia boudieri ATCC MYA-4762]
CFPFWQDLLACYVVNTADGNAEGKWKCIPQRDDYFECLHHKKEASMLSLPANYFLAPTVQSDLVNRYYRLKK